MYADPAVNIRCSVQHTKEEGADDAGHDLSVLVVDDELSVFQRAKSVVA